MLIPAVFFWQIVLGIHVVFVVATLGVLVAYPVIALAAERLDRSSVPLLHRVRQLLGRSLINPGLLVVVIAGFYLAADLHTWHDFYVQWGIGVVIVLGALEGAFVTRQSGRLAKLAQHDLDAAAGGEIKWSSDYVAARSRADQVNALMAVLVIVTVFLMVIQ
jgi:nitrogen fixation/metabolism regulation signal transduction histidine kinase